MEGESMLVIIIVGVIFMTLVAFGGCAVAGREDERLHKQHLEYIKSKNNENNKTNNEGE